MGCWERAPAALLFQRGCRGLMCCGQVLTDCQHIQRRFLTPMNPGFKANPSPNYKPRVCGSKYVSEMVLNHLISKADVQQENRRVLGVL